MAITIDFDNIGGTSLSTLIEARRALEIMLASDGWRMYCTFMEAQQAVLLNSIVMQSLASADRIYAQEHEKGRYAALDLVQEHLPVLIQQLSNEIASRPEDDTIETTDATDADADTTQQPTTWTDDL